MYRYKYTLKTVCKQKEISVLSFFVCEIPQFTGAPNNNVFKISLTNVSARFKLD